MSTLVAFLVGIAFAVGLGIGGMTQPARVLAFLDVTGPWDPSLAFVMLGAVVTYGVGFRTVMHRARPLLAPAFVLPTRRDLDAPLLVGAAIFGIGWGLAGICPGPALTALGSGEPRALVFVTTMIAGIAAQRLRGPSAVSRSERPASRRSMAAGEAAHGA
jgi:uncharacterized membrane protein YedE/YeeE